MNLTNENPAAREGANGAKETNRFLKDTSQASIQQSADAEVVRVILRRVPWPRDGGNSGRKLRWDVLTEGGELIVAASEEPLNQAAHALIARGVPPEALLTARHEGSSFDAWVPMPISGPATAWQRKRDRAAKARAYFGQNRPDHVSESVDPVLPPTQVAPGPTEAEIGGVA